VKAIENNVCVTIMILSHNTNIFVIASYSSALEIAQHSWKKTKTKPNYLTPPFAVLL
jgi:hypothetical protein